jgi:hypothetical protein
MTDRFSEHYGDSGIVDLIIILLICFFIFWIVAAIWSPFSDAMQQKQAEPGLLPKPLPKPPAMLGGFPIDRAEREFTYLERLLTDFRPSDFRGGGFETAIQPFKDHISEAINSHNATVNKHNAEVAKFVDEVMQVILELERKTKK